MGSTITLPYLYNRREANNWLTDMVGSESADTTIHLVLIGMLFLFFASVRAIALLSSPPSVWRSTGNETNNIDALIQYRDSRLKGMNNEQGSQLLRETQVLDSLGRYPQGTEAHKVSQYMNGRLGGMTYEQGLNYLKNPSKK